MAVGSWVCVCVESGGRRLVSRGAGCPPEPCSLLFLTLRPSPNSLPAVPDPRSQEHKTPRL